MITGWSCLRNKNLISIILKKGSMFLATNYSVFPPTEILDKNAMTKTPS